MGLGCNSGKVEVLRFVGTEDCQASGYGFAVVFGYSNRHLQCYTTSCLNVEINSYFIFVNGYPQMNFLMPKGNEIQSEQVLISSNAHFQKHFLFE